MRGYTVLIFFSFAFIGMSRGSFIFNLSTIIVEMYSRQTTNFNPEGNILALLTVSNQVGSLLASLISVPLISRLGRKKTLIIAAYIQLVFNILQTVRVHWIYLLVMRLFSGFANSMQMTAAPMLFSEFLEPSVRGVFLSLINVFINIGMLISYIVNHFIRQDQLFYVAFIPSIIFAACVAIIVFFLREKSALSLNVAEHILRENVWQRKYWKCFLVAVSLGINQFAGQTPIINFATRQFKNSLQIESAQTVGAIIVAAMSLIGCLVALPIVRAFRRKVVLACANGVMFASYIYFIVIYFVWKEGTAQFINLTICSALYLFGFQVGWGSLYFTIYGEVFPLRVKTFFMNFTQIIYWLSVITVTYIYPLVESYVSYIIFFCISAVELVLVLIYVPETYNKTLEEIEHKMLPRGATIGLYKMVPATAEGATSMPGMQGALSESAATANAPHSDEQEDLYSVSGKASDNAESSSMV